MFAKLYGEDDDQVLVVIQEGDTGPEVKISTVPEGFGICSMAAQFSDNEQGWDKAQAAFDDIGEDEARQYASGIVKAVLGAE